VTRLPGGIGTPPASPLIDRAGELVRSRGLTGGFATLATMAGRKLDRWERAGADLVAQILGGSAVAMDTERSADAMHDFNIVGLADSRVVALEITSVADSSVVSQLKVAFGREWRFPRLANNWMIGIQQSEGDPPAVIKEVMSRMVPILELFELRGETSVEVRSSARYRFRAPGVADEMHEPMTQMCDLRVEAARLWDTPEPGQFGAVYLSISGGMVSNPEKLNELVVERVEKKINKLRAAPADERHLLAWVDSSHEDAELAFATLPPPPPPSVPAGIDVIWLVGPTGGPDSVRIWRLRPPGPWEVQTPPSGYELLAA
jgi:hypothetical protein